MQPAAIQGVNKMTEILFYIIFTIVGFLFGRAYQAITSLPGQDITEDI